MADRDREFARQRAQARMLALALNEIREEESRTRRSNLRVLPDQTAAGETKSLRLALIASAAAAVLVFGMILSLALIGGEPGPDASAPAQAGTPGEHEGLEKPESAEDDEEADTPRNESRLASGNGENTISDKEERHRDVEDRQKTEHIVPREEPDHKERIIENKPDKETPRKYETLLMQGGRELDAESLMLRSGDEPLLWSEAGTERRNENELQARVGRVLITRSDVTARDAGQQLTELITTLRIKHNLNDEEVEIMKKPSNWKRVAGISFCVLMGTAIANGNVVSAQDNESKGSSNQDGVASKDTNGDGELSFEELFGGVPAEHAAMYKMLFDRADTDKSGSLSVAEMKAANISVGKDSASASSEDSSKSESSDEKSSSKSASSESSSSKSSSSSSSSESSESSENGSSSSASEEDAKRAAEEAAKKAAEEAEASAKAAAEAAAKAMEEARRRAEAEAGKAKKPRR